MDIRRPKEDNKKWVLDTGATTHMTHSKDQFKDLVNIKVTTTTDEVLPVIGKGDVKLKFQDKGKIKKLELRKTVSRRQNKI